VSWRHGAGHRSRLLTATLCCLVCVGSTVLACGLASAAPPARPSVTRSANGLLSWGGFLFPFVMDTPSGLYMAWSTSTLGTVNLDELGLMSRSNGQVEAERSLQGALDSGVLYGGSLFVVTTAPSGVWLLRLDSQTLSLESRWHVAAASKPLSVGSLAIVGKTLWVAGGDRLLRVSLSTNRPLVSLVVTAASRWSLATDPEGHALVVSASTADGIARIERRDPLTGRLLASTPPLVTVDGFRLGGVYGDGVWTASPGGMLGAVERFDLMTMNPPRCASVGNTDACVQGSNGISVLVSHGLLWVFGAEQAPGGPLNDYCANPTTGHVLAAVSIQPNEDSLIAVGSHLLYIADQGTGTVSEEPVPRGCLLNTT
jgi:hypothetical protein